jgi:heavy metal sensor kinase
LSVHSLRFRLIWIHSAAIAIVVVCTGLIRYQRINYRSHRQFDRDLFRDAELFASRFQIDRAGIILPADNLSTRDASVMREMEHYFVITDLQGQVLREDLHDPLILAMLERGELKSILRQHRGFAAAIAKDGSEYRFISLPVRTGVLPQPAILHAGRSVEPQKWILREYITYYLYSVPLILAISVAVGWFLTSRALKPFEEITRTAEKITYENLNTQIYTERREEEVQRLVLSFNAMVRRLDQAFRRVRKFNADAAHELRTPLAILQGETEVALRSPNVPDEIRAVLESNLEEIDRLTRIVSDLLMLAEAEAGRQVLIKEPVDVPMLLRDVIGHLRSLVSDRQVTISLQCIPELWIDADKLWLRRAVINLVENAVKYSKEGGKVEVNAGIEGKAARITIRDYGIGILPDDLPYIFDRLYRADPARNRDSGGVGLGLAIVKWIIEAHEGSLRVESEPDRGTRFEVSLPARPA